MGGKMTKYNYIPLKGEESNLKNNYYIINS